VLAVKGPAGPHRHRGIPSIRLGLIALATSLLMRDIGGKVKQKMQRAGINVPYGKRAIHKQNLSRARYPATASTKAERWTWIRC
jgi:hypothetical protein